MKLLLSFLIVFFYMFSGKAQPDYRDGPIPVTATETYIHSSGAAKALLYFDYVSADRKLRKPLIVFEGFDPGVYTMPNEKEGRTGIQDLIDDITLDAVDPATTTIEDLLQGSTQQYDIVYVNWKNGTDYIQNNALLAEEVIRWVNTNKIPVGGVIQPNVIMGKSMGSIIARIALKRMEDEHAAHPTTKPLHNTRLYISLDGGMQGSNLPQGYQHLANHFRQLYIASGPTALAVESGAGTINFISENIGWINRVGSPAAMLSVNHTPAARQLTINYVNTGQTVDNTVHNSFVAELGGKGYPNGDGSTAFRKVAVSNGSECAKPQDIGSGGNLLTYYGRISPTFWATVLGGVDYAFTNSVGGASYFGAIPVFTLSTLPGRNSFNFDIAVNAKQSGVGNQVYRGKITYAKKLFGLINITATLTNKSYSADAATLAYDYFPGGNQDLATELELPEANSNWLFTRDITFIHKPYCHVPVPSALDLGLGAVALTQADYLTPYRGSTPPGPPKSTPFTQGFITAFNGQPDNEPHATIVRRNGDWIANELQQVSPNVAASCEILCGNAIISGNDMLCSGQSQYTIPGFPATGASVVWQSSNNSIATVSNAGLLTKGAGNGAITLTATITACNRSLVVTKSVFVGTPDPLKFIIYNDQPCAGYPVGFGAYYEEATFCSLNRAKATNVEWEVVSPYSYQINSNSGMGYCDAGNINNSGVTINFYRNYSSYTAQVRFRAQNACGWSGWSSYKTLTVQPCGSGLMAKITPNPATGTATIAVEEMAAAKTASIEKSGITQIKVVDKSGNIKLVKSFAKGLKQVQLNTNGLPSDIYSVHILYGKEWTVQKLMVQH